VAYRAVASTLVVRAERVDHGASWTIITSALIAEPSMPVSIPVLGAWKTGRGVS
jgi:hypothetical protein